MATGRRVQPAIAAAVALALLVLPFRVGSWLLPAVFLLGAWRVYVWAQRGHGPPFGRLIALAMALWGVGHLVEIATRVRPSYTHLFSPADALFVLLLPGTVAVSLMVFSPELRRVDAAATLRMAIDAMLVAISAVTLQWFVLLRPLHEDGRLPTLAGIYSVFFVACLALTFAAQLFGAVRTGDPGLRWLATAVGLLTAGVGFWSVGIVENPHDQRIGPALLAAGIALMPAAQAHPAPRHRDEVQQGAQHELILPMLVATGAWLACAPVMLGSGDHPVLVGLLLATLFLISVRMLVVRSAARAQTARLRAYAFSDPLTGLGNRRAATRQLDQAAGWLLVTDLDRFKEVNDRHGHDAGDELLAGFADRLRESMPADASIARLGGDEFVVLLPPDVERPDVHAVADRVLECGADPRFPAVSVSVGVAAFSQEEEAATALRSADVALRAAKASGGRRVELVDRHMLDARLREVELVDRLRRGMGDALRVEYQPVVSLDHTGTPVVAVEALARWTDPLLGEVSPAEFIPLAEASGTIGDLGLRVLAEALDRLEVWHAAGLRLHATVNVSWAQVRDAHVLDEMRGLIRARPHSARSLILEATESGFSTDPDGVAAFGALRRMGVRIAIDDFGAGSFSLSRLRRLPVDILKVDRELVCGIADDADAEAVLAATSQLARSLGLPTVAEGVEDAATADVARGLGVTHAQGWFFGRPAPADRLAVDEAQARGDLLAFGRGTEGSPFGP